MQLSGKKSDPHNTAESTDDRQLNAFIVLLLFLVVALPLSYIRHRIEQMAIKNEIWQRTENKTFLHNQMKSFKTGLAAATQALKTVNDVCETSGFNDAMAALPSENQPLLLREALKKILQNQLDLLQVKANHLPEPLFVVLANESIRQNVYHYSDSFVTALAQPDEAALFLCIYPDIEGKNRLPEATGSFVRSKLNEWGGGRNTNISIEQKYGELFGAYLAKRPMPGQVSRIASDFFSFGHVLYITRPVFTEAGFAGLMVAGFLEEDFSATGLIRQALADPLQPGLKRVIFPPQARPKLQKHETAIFSPLPWTLQKKLTAGNDQITKNWKIGVILSGKKSGKYEAFLRTLSMLNGFLVLFCWAGLIRATMFSLRLPLSLRRKFIMVLSAGIVLPAAFTGVIAAGIHDQIEKHNSGMTQSRLTSGLDEFEIHANEVCNRMILNNLGFKLKLTSLLQSKKPNEISPELIGKYLVIYSRFLLYDIEGNFLNLQGTSRRKTIDRFLLNNCVRTLDSLSGLKINRITRKHLDEMAFTDGFTDGTIDHQTYRDDAARELENIASMHSVNQLTRDSFFLLPDLDSRPMKPLAMCNVNLKLATAFKSYMTDQPGFYLNLFYRHESVFSENYAMALRDNESIETEFWLDDSTRQPEELLDLQYRAFNSQNSGSSVSDNDSTTMTEWRIFRDWPFIFVGMASSSQHDILRLFLDLLPWFLAATALVIILFLTEIMSRLFMGPVETILAGIREVSQNNNLHLKIQIKNNDEFDMLGNAFNSMTAGLLQKKHISRFISSGIHKRDENEHTVINGKAAVLASDIRGFTTLSEQESPESVVALLNDYFTLMESAIISEQGTIDKYIGDAIIAVFREGQLQNPSLAACRAAIKMRAAIAQLNENSPLKIDNGIGISTGEITMVHVGDANSRRDIIMMGKPVETAEELEAMTKSGTYSRIFIDSATATAVNNEFLLSEQAETTPTAIFEIIKAAEASS